ncbi:MAG: DUF58 domain-containing protein [Acidobacteriota bacterium]|nr:DUF58 domain-containing protein [Blastocatellia bacterium]MDW8412317.1 DUF58 domain-containing protein [Acidobacteriota bacterium]
MSQESSDKAKFRRMLREFLITSSFFGSSFLLAMLSTFLLQTGDYDLAVFSALASLILATIGGIYIVPKLASRIKFTFLKIPYSVTAETIFFLVTTIVVGIAAVNTGNNLLYLVLSVLLAVLMASGIISETSLRGIDVSLRFPEHIFADQETMLELTLINRKAILPSFSVTVGILSELEQEEEHKSFGQKLKRMLMGIEAQQGLKKFAHFSVLPGNCRLTQRINYTFRHRGCFLITGFTVSTKFPFGFLRKTHEKQALGELVVYPRLRPFYLLSSSIPVLAGSVESIRRGLSCDLYRIRPYQFRDNLRHVAWKATAKTRRLMVKEFTREDERKLTVVLDELHTMTRTLEEKFELAIEIAASLIEHFLEQGAELRLLTPVEQTDFDTGQQHFYRMMRILALAQPTYDKERLTLEQMLDDDQNDYKVVFTDRSVGLPDKRDVKVVDLSSL